MLVQYINDGMLCIMYPEYAHAGVHVQRSLLMLAGLFELQMIKLTGKL